MSGFLLCLFVTAVLNYTPALTEKISSKLDFGLDSDDQIQIKSDSQILEARNLPTRSPNDGGGGGGGKHVVCSETGCNTTEVQTKTNGILTDVLVHVQTSGGGSSIVTNNDSIPDVPVIVGYGGTSPSDITSDSLQNSKPLIVTNIEEVYPDLNRRVDQGNTFYSTSNPRYGGGTTQTFATIPGDRGASFTPSNYYNKQAVWYPKNSVSFNPVEFKRFQSRPDWSRRPTPGGYRSYETTTPPTGYTTCMCQNAGLNWYPTTSAWQVGGQKVGYARPLIRGRENAEAHIDDKLGSFD